MAGARSSARRFSNLRHLGALAMTDMTNEGTFCSGEHVVLVNIVRQVRVDQVSASYMVTEVI